MSNHGRRLDNGRSKAFLASSQPTISQDGDFHSQAAVQPLTSPFCFDLLERLLHSHTWSTYSDENGKTTAMHVETKEGQDRLKYILGADEPSGNLVLLSKQQMLRETVGSFITLKVKAMLLDKPTFVLIREDVPKTTISSNKKLRNRGLRPQKPTAALHGYNGSADVPEVKVAEHDYLKGWLQPDRRSSSSSNCTIGFDTTSSGSTNTPRNQNVGLSATLSYTNIPTASKRKRLVPGSYTHSMPSPDRKRPRVVSSPGSKKEVIELDSESESDAENSIVEISGDEDVIPYNIDKENVSYLGPLSQGLQNVNFGPRSTAAINKHARVDDWFGSSQ